MSDYYLDENLSTMPTINYGEGLDTTTNLTLLNRCWNKDRFTTAALRPQKVFLLVFHWLELFQLLVMV